MNDERFSCSDEPNSDEPDSDEPDSAEPDSSDADDAGAGSEGARSEEDAWSLRDRARMDSLEDDAFGSADVESANDAAARDEARTRLEGCGLEALKEHLGSQLRPSDRLKSREGVPTGIESFDRGLLWGGFPKGEMTLLWGELGCGATTLWIEAACAALKARRWAAWVDGEAPLCPTPLRQKGADLSRLLVTRAAPEKARAQSTAAPQRRSGPHAQPWLRLAQELLASTLFEIVGSGDDRALLLRETQARKLLAACRSSNAAMVLIARGPPPPYAELFALIARFEGKRMLVERAAHRPPFEVPRRVSYATFSQHSRTRVGANFGPALESSQGTQLRPGDGAIAGAHLVLTDLPPQKRAEGNPD